MHYTEDEKLNEMRKKHRNMLMQKRAITTWGIDPKKIKKVIYSLTDDVVSFKGFRFFRIKQIGMNSSDNYNLALSGFELYGTGYGDWAFDSN